MGTACTRVMHKGVQGQRGAERGTGTERFRKGYRDRELQKAEKGVQGHRGQKEVQGHRGSIGSQRHIPHCIYRALIYAQMFFIGFCSVSP